MTRASAILAAIPAREWIDLGYMLLTPAVLLTGCTLLLSLRP